MNSNKNSGLQTHGRTIIKENSFWGHELTLVSEKFLESKTPSFDNSKRQHVISSSILHSSDNTDDVKKSQTSLNETKSTTENRIYERFEFERNNYLSKSNKVLKTIAVSWVICLICLTCTTIVGFKIQNRTTGYKCLTCNSGFIIMAPLKPAFNQKNAI